MFYKSTIAAVFALIGCTAQNNSSQINTKEIKNSEIQTNSQKENNLLYLNEGERTFLPKE